jgi:hypothetical protein
MGRPAKWVALCRYLEVVTPFQDPRVRGDDLNNVVFNAVSASAAAFNLAMGRVNLDSSVCTREIALWLKR